MAWNMKTCIWSFPKSWATPSFHPFLMGFCHEIFAMAERDPAWIRKPPSQPVGTAIDSVEKLRFFMGKPMVSWRFSRKKPIHWLIHQIIHETYILWHTKSSEIIRKWSRMGPAMVIGPQILEKPAFICLLASNQLRFTRRSTVAVARGNAIPAQND